MLYGRNLSEIREVIKNQRLLFESDQQLQSLQKSYKQTPTSKNAAALGHGLKRAGRHDEAAQVDIGHHAEEFKKAHEKMRDAMRQAAKHSWLGKRGEARSVARKASMARHDAINNVYAAHANLRSASDRHNREHVGDFFPPKDGESFRQHIDLLSSAHGGEPSNSARERGVTREDTLGVGKFWNHLGGRSLDHDESAARFQRAVRQHYPNVRFQTNSHSIRSGPHEMGPEHTVHHVDVFNPDLEQ